MLADRLFGITAIVLLCTFVFGWMVLLTITLLKSIFPSKKDLLERNLQFIGKIVSPIQNCSIIIIFILLILYLISKFVNPLSSFAKYLFQ